MSADDLLRDRLRSAADAAGAHANPSAAMRLIEAGPPPPPTGPKLWLVSVIGAVAVAAGTLAGATVLSPDGPGPSTSANGGSGIHAAAQTPTDPATPMAGAAFDCPGGAAVGQLRAGDRVYVVGRDDSGAWSAIRDPRNLSDVVWVETAALVPDASLDVDVVGCDEPTPLLPPEQTPETTTTTTTTSTTVPGAPSTTVAEPLKPGTPPTSAPGATTPGGGAPSTTTSSTPPPTNTKAPSVDTQAPNIVQVTRSPNEIMRDVSPYCDTVAVITVNATDDIGVVSVTGTYSGLPRSPLHFTRTGGTPQNGTWTATFGPFTSITTQDVTITITASDASDKTVTATTTIKYWGSCVS